MAQRRVIAPLTLLAGAAVIGYATLIDHTGGVTFPLSATAASTPSPLFHASGGLYLIHLETDAVGDRHHTACLLGGDVGALSRDPPCDPSPPPTFTWTLYRDGRAVAVSGPSQMRGVDGYVRLGHDGRIEKEVGSVDLEALHAYRLSVTVRDPERVLSRPTVRVRLHPWDVKDGMAYVLLGLLATVILGGVGLVKLIAAFKRPPHRRSADDPASQSA